MHGTTPDTGEAVWVEEDYCSPPLAMERDAVLDDYFTDVRVVHDDVDETVGWERIDDLPSLWEVESISSEIHSKP